MLKTYKGVEIIKLNILLKIIFAIKGLIKIATNKNKRPVAIKKIAKEYNISYYYLEQIFIRLKRAGIVRPVIGFGGGFILNKAPEKISLFHIYKALNTSIDILKSKYYYRPTLLKENLSQKIDVLIFKILISRFAKFSENILRSVTIADIIKDGLSSCSDYNPKT